MRVVLREFEESGWHGESSDGPWDIYFAHRYQLFDERMHDRSNSCAVARGEPMAEQPDGAASWCLLCCGAP